MSRLQRTFSSTHSLSLSIQSLSFSVLNISVVKINCDAGDGSQGKVVERAEREERVVYRVRMLE